MNIPTILNKIVDQKKIEVAKRQSQISIETLFETAKAQSRKPLDFYKSLKNHPQIAIIAEVKKASPSKGLICKDFDPKKIATAYNQSDVQAISVLTETKFFLGDDEYLKEVKKICETKPILRKDFVISKYQIIEAYLIGADAVLLIAACLSDQQIVEFNEIIESLSMQSLIEVHDKQEAKRVFSLGINLKVVGVNNRNLHNFEVDLSTTPRVRECFPAQICVVSESGISQKKDIDFLQKEKIDAVLVGERFVKSPNIKDAILELRLGCV